MSRTGRPEVRVVELPGAYRWVVVAQLWIVCFLNYADRQAIYSVFPLIRQDLHLSDIQLGLLGSSFMWMYAVAGPFAGWLTDRLRRKWVIVAALLFWSAATAATAFVSRFEWLLLVRALGGLGEAFYFPAALSLIADYHPGPTRSRSMAVHQSSVYVGTVAGGALSGLVAERHGWHLSFVLFGAAGLLCGLLLCVALKEPARALSTTGPRFSVNAVLDLFSNRFAAALAFLFAGANFVAAVFLTWLPTYLHDTMHLSLAAAGLDSTLYLQGTSVVGVLLGGVAADRLVRRYAGGRMLSQAIGLLVGAPFLFAIGRSQTLAPTLLALTGFGLCKGVYDANIWASLYDTIPGSLRGAAAGLMNSIGWIGGGVAPLAIAYSAGHMSRGTAISSTGAVYLLLATGMYLLGTAFTRSRRTSPVTAA